MPRCWRHPSTDEPILHRTGRTAGASQAKDPTHKVTGRKLHDHMMAYRNEQLLWQQVAEFNYDAYQIRSRGRR